MNKKTMCFDLSSSSIKIKEILQTKDFLMIELWAISDEYPNNNTSHFPYSTMQANVRDKVFYNKPILGKFNNMTLNYEVHNSQNKYDPEYDIAYKDYENGERPLGVIRESDDVRLEKDENGINWIVFTAVLWVKYNYQGIKKILKSKTSKVSVEVTVFKSHFDEDGIEIFDKWTFDGVTILGYRPNSTNLAKEGINNAHLSILEKMGQSEFSHQIRSLQFAYDEFDKNKDIKENNSHLYIKKNEEEEGIELLTYEQKRDLLQEQLNSFLKEEEWGYVCDLDETNVFFRIEQVTYRTTYSFNEDETECSINFDEKVRVINTWKDFEDETSEEKQKEEFENNEIFEKKDDDLKEEPEKKEETCGPDKECEKKDDDSKEDPEQKTESDNNSDDDKADEDKDDDVDDKDDSKEEPEKKEEESDLTGEAFNDEDKQDDSKECSKEDEDKEKDCCGKLMEEQKFIIDNIEYTAQEMFEKYNILFNQYNEKVQECNEYVEKYNKLSQSFSVMELENKDLHEKNIRFESELNELKNEVMSVQVKEFAETAKKFSDIEIQQFVDNCKKGMYSSLKEAQKEIAYQSFIKDDNVDNSKQTEFSAKADIGLRKQETKSEKKNNSFDDLKNYISK